jgi:hypothetical protein
LLEYFAILIADLGLLTRSEAAQIENGTAEVKRMLTGPMTSLAIQHDR